MAHGAAVLVVAALGPAHRGDIVFHQGLHDLRPRPDRDRQQTLPGRGDDLVERDLHAPIRPLRFGASEVAAVVFLGLPMAVPSPRMEHPECLPHGRHQGGDRHLNFHGGRDNVVAGHR